MVIFIVIMVLLVSGVSGSLIYYQTRKKQNLRLSIAFLTVPVISMITGIILFVDYIGLSFYTQSQPKITPMKISFVSQLIVGPSTDVPNNYIPYFQTLFMISLISFILLSVLFIVENLFYSRKK